MQWGTNFRAYTSSAPFIRLYASGSLHQFFIRSHLHQIFPHFFCHFYSTLSPSRVLHSAWTMRLRLHFSFYSPHILCTTSFVCVVHVSWLPAITFVGCCFLIFSFGACNFISFQWMKDNRRCACVCECAPKQTIIMIPCAYWMSVCVCVWSVYRTCCTAFRCMSTSKTIAIANMKHMWTWNTTHTTSMAFRCFFLFYFVVRLLLWRRGCGRILIKLYSML